jgi:hypothetical protein
MPIDDGVQIDAAVVNPPDIEAFFQDHPGAKKPNTRDDALDQLRCCELDVPDVAAKPEIRIAGDDRQSGRGQENQPVSSHTGGATVVGSLVSHDKTQK